LNETSACAMNRYIGKIIQPTVKRTSSFIIELTLMLKIIGQCDVKHNMRQAQPV
jgi:hypothetical protein